MRITDSPKKALRQRGFTLIELLIVVLIIAILAAIAVPNFMEFQTRAKVARVKSDFRALATGLEAYFVDFNEYPWRDDLAGSVPATYSAVGYRLTPLTTPISYRASVALRDCFIEEGAEGGYADNWPRDQYNYRNYEHYSYGYTSWTLNSLGPDRTKNKGLQIEPTIRGDASGTVVYDPTNGTISAGDIPWTGGDTRYTNH